MMKIKAYQPFEELLDSSQHSVGGFQVIQSLWRVIQIGGAPGKSGQCVEKLMKWKRMVSSSVNILRM